MKNLLLMLLAVLSVFSCQQAKSTAIQVMVSIPPQKYLVQRIGGDAVQVHVMVPHGKSPGMYEPAPAQVLLFPRLKAYFSLGIPAESTWLPSLRESFPALIIVDTSEKIAKLELSDYHDHGGHSGVKDPHIWTSPVLSKIQAGHIVTTLIKLQPDQEQTFMSNYRVLISDLDILDSFIRSLSLESHSLLVYHPAWTYFCEQYGLEQISIEIEGKEPTPTDIMGILQQMKDQSLDTIFVQPMEMNPSLEMIAKQTGAKIVIIDSLSPDYLVNLSNVVLKMHDSFNKGEL